ncbi:Gfo/Idh/MocA family oxidoreductase [Candidatus Micrarchaeota archaeon]|nr:Gfo/Idh/MocA family oxidoreductase [Candidatus Micrarchaeota archaeon]
MNVMVVGAGMMGFNHVRNFSSFNNVKHVIVVDSSEEALKKVSSLGHCGTVSAYKTIEEALKNENVDAATIIVPTNSHYKVASSIIAKGIPTLVEKPITETIEDGKKLITEAKDCGVMLMVGHIERFNPAVQALKKNIHHLGVPFYASVHRFGVPTERDVGPAFIDQAVHDIDILTFLVGKYPSEVSAVEARIADKKSNDLCSAIFEFGSFTATVEANRVTPIKSRELVILGTAGAAKLDYISQDLTIMRADHVTTKYSTFDEIVLRVGRGTEIKPYFVKDEPLKLELMHFLDCVKNKKEPLTTGMDGLHALAAAVAGMKAAKSGKRESICI